MGWFKLHYLPEEGYTSKSVVGGGLAGVIESVFLAQSIDGGPDMI